MLKLSICFMKAHYLELYQLYLELELESGSSLLEFVVCSTALYILSIPKNLKCHTFQVHRS